MKFNSLNQIVLTEVRIMFTLRELRWQGQGEAAGVLRHSSAWSGCVSHGGDLCKHPGVTRYSPQQRAFCESTVPGPSLQCPALASTSSQ